MAGYTENQFWENTDQYVNYDSSNNFMGQSQTLGKYFTIRLHFC